MYSPFSESLRKRLLDASEIAAGLPTRQEAVSFFAKFTVVLDGIHQAYVARYDVDLTRFNKIVIETTETTDKEAVGLSRVHMSESKCILPLRNNCLFCS